MESNSNQSNIVVEKQVKVFKWYDYLNPGKWGEIYDVKKAELKSGEQKGFSLNPFVWVAAIANLVAEGGQKTEVESGNEYISPENSKRFDEFRIKREAEIAEKAPEKGVQKPVKVAKASTEKGERSAELKTALNENNIDSKSLMSMDAQLVNAFTKRGNRKFVEQIEKVQKAENEKAQKPKAPKPTKTEQKIIKIENLIKEQKKSFGEQGLLVNQLDVLQKQKAQLEQAQKELTGEKTAVIKDGEQKIEDVRTGAKKDIREKMGAEGKRLAELKKQKETINENRDGAIAAAEVIFDIKIEEIDKKINSLRKTEKKVKEEAKAEYQSKDRKSQQDEFLNYEENKDRSPTRKETEIADLTEDEFVKQAVNKHKEELSELKAQKESLKANKNEEIKKIKATAEKEITDAEKKSKEEGVEIRKGVKTIQGDRTKGVAQAIKDGKQELKKINQKLGDLAKKQKENAKEQRQLDTKIKELDIGVKKDLKQTKGIADDKEIAELKKKITAEEAKVNAGKKKSGAGATTLMYDGMTQELTALQKELAALESGVKEFNDRFKDANKGDDKALDKKIDALGKKVANLASVEEIKKGQKDSGEKLTLAALNTRNFEEFKKDEKAYFEQIDAEITELKKGIEDERRLKDKTAELSKKIGDQLKVISAKIEKLTSFDRTITDIRTAETPQDTLLSYKGTFSTEAMKMELSIKAGYVDKENPERQNALNNLLNDPQSYVNAWKLDDNGNVKSGLGVLLGFKERHDTYEGKTNLFGGKDSAEKNAGAFLEAYEEANKALQNDKLDDLAKLAALQPFLECVGKFPLTKNEREAYFNPDNIDAMLRAKNVEVPGTEKVVPIQFVQDTAVEVSPNREVAPERRAAEDKMPQRITSKDRAYEFSTKLGAIRDLVSDDTYTKFENSLVDMKFDVVNKIFKDEKIAEQCPELKEQFDAINLKFNVGREDVSITYTAENVKELNKVFNGLITVANDTNGEVFTSITNSILAMRSERDKLVEGVLEVVNSKKGTAEQVTESDIQNVKEKLEKEIKTDKWPPKVEDGVKGANLRESVSREYKGNQVGAASEVGKGGPHTR